VGDDRGRVVERVRKLLALGGEKSHTTEHEAQLALETAHELLREHDLEMAEIEEQEAFAPIEVTKDLVFIAPKRWRLTLYSVVAQYNYCALLCRPWQGGTTVTFIGRPTNVAAAKLMAEWLCGQLDRLATSA